jgi:predicted nucleic acid-binding protein
MFKCLVDSNALIYLLSGVESPLVLNRIEQALRHQSCISDITRIEVLGWQTHSETSLLLARQLLNSLPQIELRPDVVECAIQLRLQVRAKLPDAVIAATALCEGLPLMTRNSTDFQRFEGLQIIDPFADVA